MIRAVTHFVQPHPFQGLVELHEGSRGEMRCKLTEGRGPGSRPPSCRADGPRPTSRTEYEKDSDPQQRQADHRHPDEHDRASYRHLSIISPLAGQGNRATIEELLRASTQEGPFVPSHGAARRSPLVSVFAEAETVLNMGYTQATARRTEFLARPSLEEECG